MRKEYVDSIAKNGATPVQYLERIELLGPDVLAAHCIWTDYTDMKILAERQVGCVHNPSSNMMLASGVAPVVDQRAAGIRVGLGTDGPAGSNNDLDMMEEMDLASKLQKTYRVDPRALGAKGAFEMATIEGARALHMEKEIGSLEIGQEGGLRYSDAGRAQCGADVRCLFPDCLRAESQRSADRGGGRKNAFEEWQAADRG